MIDTISLSRAAVAAVTVMALAGCSSSYVGTESGLEQYSGDWVFDTLRVASPEGRAFEFVGVSGDIDPAAIEAVAKQASILPERITVQVGDSSFRVSGSSPGSDFTLPLDGSPGRVSDQEAGEQPGIRLVWRGRAPVVERSFSENSQILDRYEVTAEGSLVITRTVRLAGTAGKNPVEIVYRRNGEPSSRLKRSGT